MSPAHCIRPLYRSPDLSASLVRYAPGAIQADHAHDYHQVSFLLSGELNESGKGARRVREVWRPSVGVKPAGLVHANAYGKHGALLLALSVHASDLEGMDLADWGWEPAHSGLPVQETLRVLVGRKGGDPREGVMDLLALGVGAGSVPEAPGVRPPWLDMARSALREEPGLSMHDLARDCGIHPVHLSRAFSLHFGCTPTSFRAHVRLMRALSHLGAEGATVCRAAHDAGFADQSHFCREARRVIGLSPGQLHSLFGREVQSVQAEGGASR